MTEQRYPDGSFHLIEDRVFVSGNWSKAKLIRAILVSTIAAAVGIPAANLAGF